MGNIGNPVINRLGKNVFWYNFWFSKYNYAHNTQKNTLFLLLLQIYLKYGIATPTNVYKTAYWFNRSEPTGSNSSYYRWSLFFNELNKTQTRHRFRITAGLFYKTRLVLLKYGGWILVLTQWFEPDRRRRDRLTRSKQKNFSNVVFSRSFSPLHLERFRSLSKLLAVKSVSLDSPYQF